MGEALKQKKDCIVVTLTGGGTKDVFELPLAERGRIISFLQEEQELREKGAIGIDLQDAAELLAQPIEQVLAIARMENWELKLNNGSVTLPIHPVMHYQTDKRGAQDRGLQYMVMLSEKMGLYEND